MTSSKLDPFRYNTAAYTEVKALDRKVIFLKPLCFLQKQTEVVYFRLKLVAVLSLPLPFAGLAVFLLRNICFFLLF